MYNLIIDTGDSLYMPVVKDNVQWELPRQGAAGKLTFEIYQDDILNIEEGNAVKFIMDDEDIFFGFIFTLRDKPNTKTVNVTCYDQRRYLKNSETYVYSNLTASEVIEMIAKDFRLQLGHITDTVYKIPHRVEDNKSLFDIIQSALDETLKNTGKLYVLDDDCGKLTLFEVEEGKLNILIDNETAKTYDYSSSIDTDTYNRIKVVKKDDNSGTSQVYIAQDSENMNKWGVLQLRTEADDGINPSNQADILLSLHNKPSKKLTIKKAVGHKKLKAGYSPVVTLSIRNNEISNYMLIDNAKHSFKDNEHFVDLTLLGGDINVS